MAAIGGSMTLDHGKSEEHQVKSQVTDSLKSSSKRTTNNEIGDEKQEKSTYVFNKENKDGTAEYRVTQ